MMINEMPSFPDRHFFAPTILVVCTGNICRSPMAEGLLNWMWPRDHYPQFAINSAGTHALEGSPAEPYANRAVSEYGVDISAHRSRALDPKIVKGADLILAMEQRHVDVILGLAWGRFGNVRLLGGFDAEGTGFDIPDPYGGSLETYRQNARLIHGCLERFVAFLRKASNIDTRFDSIP